MSAHTPGPWRVSDRYVEETSVLDAGGFKVASAAGTLILGGWAETGAAHWARRPGVTFREITQEEAEANARLIAAAPDLLRELQNVVAQADRWPFLSVGMLVEHHSNIRAVIEKATAATERLLAEVAQLEPTEEQVPRAFTRRLDRDESGTWIALMAEDSDGEVELDRFGVDEDVDSDVAHLNANLDELRACIHDARNLTGNWTPGRKP